MNKKIFRWTIGSKCNVLNLHGRTILFNTEIISEPFEFWGNGKLEIAIMVKGIKGAVSLDRITKPVKQMEIFEKTG